MAYTRKGQLKDLLDSYKHAVKRNPDKADAYCSMGDVYHEQGHCTLHKGFIVLYDRTQPHSLAAGLVIDWSRGLQVSLVKETRPYTRVFLSQH